MVAAGAGHLPPPLRDREGRAPDPGEDPGDRGRGHAAAIAVVVVVAVVVIVAAAPPRSSRAPEEEDREGRRRARAAEGDPRGRGRRRLRRAGGGSRHVVRGRAHAPPHRREAAPVADRPRRGRIRALPVGRELVSFEI